LPGFFCFGEKKKEKALPQRAKRSHRVFPAKDLKPLYDFAADCRACQVKLARHKPNLADDKVKSQARGRERDDALRAAKGGSALRRIVRAAKWFAIGAAAGAIAAKVTR
jgi:hypothetical protein